MSDGRAAFAAARAFERVPTTTPGLVHLRAATGEAGGVDVFLEGVEGSPLPERLDDLAIQASDGSRGLSLVSAGVRLPVRVRGFRVHEPRARLYDAPLARFAPSPRERTVVRVLLALLRLPGSARLLRAWHARRA